MKSWDKVKLNLINRVTGLVLNIEVVLPVSEMNRLIEDSFGFNSKNKKIKEKSMLDNSKKEISSRDKVKLKLKDRIFGLVLNKEVILPVLEMNRLIEDCFESNNNRNKKINQDNNDSSITGDSKSLPVYEDYWEISHNLEGEISNNLINNNKLEVNKEHNFYLNNNFKFYSHFNRNLNISGYLKIICLCINKQSNFIYNNGVFSNSFKNTPAPPPEPPPPPWCTLYQASLYWLDQLFNYEVDINNNTLSIQRFQLMNTFHRLRISCSRKNYVNISCIVFKDIRGYFSFSILVRLCQLIYVSVGFKIILNFVLSV